MLYLVVVVVVAAAFLNIISVVKNEGRRQSSRGEVVKMKWYKCVIGS